MANTKKCQACGMNIPEEASLCPYCRSLQPERSLFGCSSILTGIGVVLVALIALGTCSISSTDDNDEKSAIRTYEPKSDESVKMETVCEPSRSVEVNTVPIQSDKYQIVSPVKQIEDTAVLEMENSVTNVSDTIIDIFDDGGNNQQRVEASSGKRNKKEERQLKRQARKAEKNDRKK